MTVYRCACGDYHDNERMTGPCERVITFRLLPPEPLTPEAVGAEIRRLLMSLRDPSHPRGGVSQSYATDELRRRALDAAGLCWLKPGEMAPGCCCDWSPEAPEGPRLALEERMEENRRLWEDECIERAHSSRSCERGTRSCVVRHRPERP